MKKPDPANLMMQVIYGIIGLFVLILIGGGITATVLYFSPNRDLPADRYVPESFL